MSKYFFLMLIISSPLMAQTYGLKDSDQKFFKNNIMEGKNAVERTDANVVEINKIYGELTTMKNEIALMRAEIEQLKKRK